MTAVADEPDAGTAAAAVQSCRCVVTLIKALECVYTSACDATDATTSTSGGNGEGADAGALFDAVRTVVGVGRIVQEDFADNGGATQLLAPLVAFADRGNKENDSAATEHSGNEELAIVGKACRAIVTWCKGFEAGKLLLMAQDAHITMTACVERMNAGTTKASKALCTLCDAIRALCTGDDVEVAASKTFTHARLMGEVGAHHALVAALKLQLDGENDTGTHGESDVNALPSLCNAIKAVGANDEMCQEIAADGAIQLLASVLASSTGKSDVVPPLTTSKAVFGLLRQLAKSDTNKALVIEQEQIIASLHRCLGTGCSAEDDDDNEEGDDAAVTGTEGRGAHTDVGSNGACATQIPTKQEQQLAGVREQAIGMLVSLSLRNPDAATMFCDDGIVAAVLESMRFHRGHHGVQRQGCMMIRNVVVRCPELRPGVLDLGAEKVIRGAKARWPDQCGDVGSAALRDLGLENYNG